MKPIELSSDSLEDLQELLNLPLDGMETYTLETVRTERGSFSCTFKGVVVPPPTLQPALTRPLQVNRAPTSMQALMHASHQHYSRKLHIAGSAPPRATSVLLPLNPEGIRSLSQQVLPGDALVIAPGQELSFDTPAGLEYVECHFAPEIVEEIQQAIGQSALPTGPRRAGALENARLIAAIEAWLEDPDPYGFLETRERATTTTEVIEAATQLFATLSAPEGRPNPAPATRRRIARTTLDFLQSNLHRPITSAELCSEARCSLRTLENAFREQTGIAPIRYHRLQRLQAARRDLRALAPEESTVTKVATERGFTHLGRFSVEYRQLFGEPPSATLASVDRSERPRTSG